MQHAILRWIIPLIILGLMGFNHPASKLNRVQVNQIDTLPQVQVISTSILNRKAWKAFAAQHSITVLDSNVSVNRHFIHWVKNRSAAKKGFSDMSRFSKPLTHSWGLLEKIDNKWELTQLLVAPSNLSLQIQDSTDFNGDSHPDLVIFWTLRHHYNHEFGTGNNQSSGLMIWDVKAARNLVSLMLTSSGSGWNMCSGKSSTYSNLYYDVQVQGKELHVKDYSKGTQLDSRIFIFARNNFSLQN